MIDGIMDDIIPFFVVQIDSGQIAVVNDIVHYPDVMACIADTVGCAVAADAGVRDAIWLKSVVAVEFEAVDDGEAAAFGDAPQMAGSLGQDMAAVQSLAAIDDVAGRGRRVAAMLDKHAGIVCAGRDIDTISRLSRGAVGVLDGAPRTGLRAGIRIVACRRNIEVAQAAVEGRNGSTGPGRGQRRCLRRSSTALDQNKCREAQKQDAKTAHLHRETLSKNSMAVGLVGRLSWISRMAEA